MAGLMRRSRTSTRPVSSAAPSDAGRAKVQIEGHGRVPDGMRELATAKADWLLRFASEPVLSARITLAVAADPAVPRPAVAQVTMDLNGRTVRAQAADETMRAAIEHMATRMRVRLDRSARDWAARRGTLPIPGSGEWRHQSVPAHRPAYFPRPAAERAVIRRAGYAPGPLTPEEAVSELDLLDYDFHLFVERSTGEDSVIYRLPGGYRLAQVRPKPDRLGPLPAAVTLSGHRAPRLLVAEAVDRLELLGQPFVFFVDAETGRASVVYHRYDGHYGLAGLGRTPTTG
jgi:ribosome-associated translation inhibitor RaiA